jgi:hypothetical protein
MATWLTSGWIDVVVIVGWMALSRRSFAEGWASCAGEGLSSEDPRRGVCSIESNN